GGGGGVELKNTGSTHTISPPTQSVADMQSSPTHSLSPADQALLDQIRSKVEALDKANGRTFDDTSERLSTSLLAAAKDAGITRADHVVLSRQTDASPAAHNIFVVQGAMSDPASLRTHMATAEAAQRPVQESLNQVEAIGERQARERSAEMQHAQEQHRASAPSM
ncbi:XVIPCD domain-containing protein, partial [Stenotrophomonas maltophilia]|uniref:XVIPCD domain-containing protein n=1 Tax=Stenotrophomonas maltophilia TaxID=40324 RepID=UPI00325B1967